MRYRVWVYTAIILFGGGMALGVAGPSDIGLPPEYIEGLKELSRFIIPGSPLTVLFILFKNVFALLVSFMFSPFLCIIPVLSLAGNGWLIGFISETAVHQKSLVYVLAGVLPHGVFELPAFIIGQAAALSFGSTILLSLSSKWRGRLVADLKRSARYLTIACILLIPAAIIETYVTPLLLT